jgi:hypothetical protein
VLSASQPARNGGGKTKSERARLAEPHLTCSDLVFPLLLHLISRLSSSGENPQNLEFERIERQTVKAHKNGWQLLNEIEIDPTIRVLFHDNSLQECSR